MKTFVSNSQQETHQLAVKLGKKLKPNDIIAFRGGLGAGKTTFVRGLVEGLGIDDFVSSPTFALVNQYEGENITLYHFDMYRVKDYDSLSSTGFFDYLDTGAITAIEWSENIQEYLPENVITISIETYPEKPQTRTFQIEGGEGF